MKNPFIAFVSESSALKRFRLILIAVLTVTVVVSAALAIFMIIASVEDETLWKVTGTFALFAGFALIMLVQTASLYRNELLDNLVGIIGSVTSGVLVFWGLDSIWEWRIIEKVFNYNDDLIMKVLSTFGLTAAVLAAVAALRSSLRIHKYIKAVTLGISLLYYVLLLLRNWFPEWFAREVTESYYDDYMNKTETYTYLEDYEFWNDTFLILGILLGAMLIVSLVSHILGGRKVIPSETVPLGMVSIPVKANTSTRLANLATQQSKSLDEIINAALNVYEK